jgi:DNA-directed RNA polymerase specialized sigma24 family protein
MSERRQLINLAYRLLGSLADAEDVVQKTHARWYARPAAQQEAIESPGAWPTRVAGRICLDQLRSARSRRERYVASGSRSRCPAVRGSAGGPAPRRPTRATSTSRSAWPSWSCSSR